MATGTRLTKAEIGNILVNEREYQSLVGSLMYAMTGTRPDLAYAVSQLSQFNAKPTAIHLTAAKRVLRYLKGHADLGITYRDDDNSLNGYCDTDWGANEDRKSISGYLFMLGGGAISWSSKKQSTVALSSTEAEYIALVQAAKESIWLQRLLSELGWTERDHKVIWEDNQGAIALAVNPEYHACTKHIDIQYHFIRECVENDRIKLEYIPTAEQLADALTKIMPRNRHWELTEGMGMGKLEQHAKLKQMSNITESGSTTPSPKSPSSGSVGEYAEDSGDQSKTLDDSRRLQKRSTRAEL